jgi:hypothetical protein
LLKTFYTGLGGWADRQLDDGTVEWTSPTEHVYTTKPGAGVFFPALAESTGELALPTTVRAPVSNRGLMMPTRRRTRAAERSARIAAERRINDVRIAADAARRRIAARNDPPPF